MTQSMQLDGAKPLKTRETQSGTNQETSASGADQPVFMKQSGRETPGMPGGGFTGT